MKGQLFIGTLIALLGASGCSDYTLEKVTVYEPNIVVTPEEHDFGALFSGQETGELEVIVTNTGNTTLNIGSVYVDGISDITITTNNLVELEATESDIITLTYTPETYQTDAASLYIHSDDPDTPIVEVPLTGQGDAPIIEISPDYHDFSTVLLGCDDEVEITIENIGNANLEISDIEYFVSVPVDFMLEDHAEIYGTLPWTLAPSDIVALNVSYLPLDILDDEGYIEITSNDPTAPVAIADQVGEGDYEGWVTDEFTQDGEVAVDIMFVIDNSGSMYSNQINLTNNFDAFIAAFGAAGVDYQIALITTDNATFVGDVITSSTPDPITEFNDQVNSIGTTGSPYERGLLFAYNATSSGGDASPTSSTGFLREPARLVVVYVSDEPDAGGSSMTPSDHSAHLLSLKSSSDLVVAHAVAGDSPSGCTGNGGAQFGDGYYDVVNDLGGTFMSICADDWSVTMDTLARDSMSILSFPLSGNPIEDTISVKVDAVASADWTYDSSANALTFSVAPSDGSEIEVTYAIWAECEDEASDAADPEK